MVFDWPKDGAFQVPKTSRKISTASSLADPEIHLSVVNNHDGSGITVKGLPVKSPDSIATVIVLEE